MNSGPTILVKFISDKTRYTSQMGWKARFTLLDLGECRFFLPPSPKKKYSKAENTYHIMYDIQSLI